MKKIQLLILVALTIFASSCKKMENEDTQEPKKFSKLSPEEHKAEVQNSAIKLVNDMEVFATSSEVQKIVDIVEMLDGVEEFKTLESTPVNSILKVEKLAKNEIDVTDFLTSYSTMEEDDEIDNIQEAYDSIKGSWVYNSTTDEFDFTSGDKFVAEFPSKDGGTSNNAKLEVTKFETKFFPSELLEEIGGYVPTEIEVKLTVDGLLIITYSLSATYDEEGKPTQLKTSLKIGEYAFEAKLSSTATSASSEYKLKNGGKNIIFFKVALNGDLKESNIESNTKYYSEECGYNEMQEWDCDKQEITKSEYESLNESMGGDVYVDTWMEVDIENILKSSYAFLEISDVRIGGELNIKEMLPVMEKIDEEEDVASDAFYNNENNWGSNFDDSPYEKRRASALNSHAHFFAAYIDDSKKIAELEFYVAEDQDSTFDYNCDYFLVNGEYVYDCTTEFKGMETYSWVDGRMVFGDDSKISAETYFNDQKTFGKFIDEINEMIRTLNNTYDGKIDTIDPDDVFYEED